MTMATNKEVFQRYLPVYLKASKKEKQALLNTVCEVTGFHRKAAIRKFRNLQLRRSGKVLYRGRPVVYGNDVIVALKFVWQTASEICGELLHPVIGDYVNVMKRDRQWNYSVDVTDKLLQMSEGTVKARVGRFMKIRSFRHGL
jgi:hypothetical protein